MGMLPAPPRGVGCSARGGVVPAGAGARHLFRGCQPGGRLGGSWPERLQMFGLYLAYEACSTL